MVTKQDFLKMKVSLKVGYLPYAEAHDYSWKKMNVKLMMKMKMMMLSCFY